MIESFITGKACMLPKMNQQQFKYKAMTMKDTSHVSIQLCETSASSSPSSSTADSSFYDGAVGAFVVFDLTNRPSFDSLQNWVNIVKEQASQYCQIVILGNKVDLLQPNSEYDSLAAYNQGSSEQQ